MYMSYLKDSLNIDFRDIKMYIVTEGDFTPEVNISKLRKGKNWIFSQPYWSILKEWKGRSTITGSVALYAFGLIDRMPKDVDLLVDASTFNPNRQLYHNRYPGMEGKMDVLGYYTDKNYNVDFFDSKEHTIIECDGFLFHHPFEIIQTKIDIIDFRSGGDNKDFYDLCDVFRKIKPDFVASVLK